MGDHPLYPEISFGTDPKVTTVNRRLIFGVVNAIIKPLIKVLALPLTLMTFGLFGLVINGGLLLLLAFVADKLDLSSRSVAFHPTSASMPSSRPW